MSEPQRKEWIGDKVQVRLLNQDEYARLVPFFLANEAAMPSAESSQVAVAEDENGDIVGFWVLQLVALASPLWIAEDYQRQGVAKLLIDELNRVTNHLQMPYYGVAEDEHLARLLAENAMQELQTRVFWHQPEPNGN